MGDRIPTESRIFADRYLRETRRLEKLHAGRLSPGTDELVRRPARPEPAPQQDWQPDQAGRRSCAGRSTI